jgi:hypothetical protein
VKRFDMAQGSAEWRKARLGIPTASSFHRIITPKTAKPSAQAEAYLHELLAELMLGRPLDNISYPWMSRGSDLEEEAASWYEFETDTSTEVVGFCTTDDGRYGASPDRLVGTDGGLELKCPSPAVHVKYLLYPKQGPDAEYRCQIMGQMLVTERKFVDIVSYHPDLPKVIIRVDRDEDYIALMRAALDDFCERLAEGKAELERRGLLAMPDNTKSAEYLTLTDRFRAHILTKHGGDEELAASELSALTLGAVTTFDGLSGYIADHWEVAGQLRDAIGDDEVKPF